MSDAEGLVKEMREACEDGDIETVRLLLGGGADINIIDEFGSTPLIYAISYGENSQAHKDVIKLLLKEGADLDIIDGDGLTVLMSAASHGDMENVRLFLDNGADPNIVDEDGEDMTAKMYATDARHTDIAKLLETHIPTVIAHKRLAVAKSMLPENEESPLNFLDTDTMQKMFGMVGARGARGVRGAATKKRKKKRKKTRKPKKSRRRKKKPKKTRKYKKTRKTKTRRRRS